jgi:hypothetical protein
MGHFLRLVSLSFVLFPLLCPAGVFAADKSVYNFFNPTPKTEMRDFAIDRPDRTESPYTVDAGHFQHETDLVSYFYDHSEGVEDQAYLFGIANLKAGLTNSIDLQVIPFSYVYQTSKTLQTRQKTSDSGYGDTVVRLKYNIFGNDSGESALGVMPYVKAPTAHGDLGNGDWEGGIILPYSRTLSEKFSLGTMTEVDLRRNTEDSGYHTEFVNTVTLGTSIAEGLSNYVELWTNLSTKETPIQITADFGFVYELCPDTLIDIGINIGLTEATTDLNTFSGLSQRF